MDRARCSPDANRLLMHEFAITQQVVKIALEAAQAQHAQRVAGVRVRVGSLTGIVQESMQFYFDALVAGTPAEGARLEVEPEPARARCHSCGWQGDVEPPLDPACPSCGQWALSVEGGRDLVVLAIEVADEPTAALQAGTIAPLAQAIYR